MWLDPAIQKTLSLLLLIGIGILLKRKVHSKEALGGVKMLILSIALPATIFVALLKIEVQSHLLFLPILALAFNLIMLFIAYKGLGILGIQKGSPAFRTWMMLLPSLAPGLSCFPFLAEYMGDESLALAALADVGNKVFVLILLYLLAMHWYYQKKEHKSKGENKLRSLSLALIREPVNLVILLALILLLSGYGLKDLPQFLQQSVSSMSAMMTPMILIFIGMAVKIKWQQFRKILQLLFLRSAFAFILSALALIFFPPLSPLYAIVLVVFPQSACSFWPFAHMAAVNKMGEQDGKETFDLDLGLGILAFSLPFSTILILAICSMGTIFMSPTALLLSAGALFTFAIIPALLPKLSGSRKALSRSIEEVKTG
ncbi:MAG: permease [Bacteroidota bacterium]